MWNDVAAAEPARVMRIAEWIRILSALLITSVLGLAQAQTAEQTVGLVFYEWRPAIHETKEASECPSGFQASMLDEFRATYKTEEEQNQVLSRSGYFINRGENGENVWFFPTAAKDSIPFKELKSTVALGLNLDGTADGAGNEKICPHGKFVDPNGRAGIDNQLYRVIGCAIPWRTSGFIDGFHATDFKTDAYNRILLEITGVGDLQNDSDVSVNLYKGRDALMMNAAGNVVPWQSQTIDDRYPRYVHRLHGRIENGVLRTDPVDVRLPQTRIRTDGEFRMQGMRLELKLTDTGADGLIAGYHNIDDFWKNFAKLSTFVDVISPQSAPNTYQALLKYADGDRDASSGECRAISAAYQVKATRVFVVHGNESARPLGAPMTAARADGSKNTASAVK